MAIRSEQETIAEQVRVVRPDEFLHGVGLSQITLCLSSPKSEPHVISGRS